MNSAFESLTVALQDPPLWWTPHLSVARQLLDARAESVAAALEVVRDSNDTIPRFVPHPELPAGEPYESFVARTGCIPTRDNLHDLFNGLVWLDWPRTKRRLNVLQAECIARHGISGARGSLRDALTVFDENAAILQAPAVLVEALRRRDWRSLFVTERSHWCSARLVLFGHALLEKLLQPRKAITAHVWLIDEISDDALAASLEPSRLVDRPFLPLPVLGVPGWWAPNEQADFYEDDAVFRRALSR